MGGRKQLLDVPIPPAPSPREGERFAISRQPGRDDAGPFGPANIPAQLCRSVLTGVVLSRAFAAYARATPCAIPRPLTAPKEKHIREGSGLERRAKTIEALNGVS